MATALTTKWNPDPMTPMMDVERARALAKGRPGVYLLYNQAGGLQSRGMATDLSSRLYQHKRAAERYGCPLRGVAIQAYPIGTPIELIKAAEQRLPAVRHRDAQGNPTRLGDRRELELEQELNRFVRAVVGSQARRTIHPAAAVTPPATSATVLTGFDFGQAVLKPGHRAVLDTWAARIVASQATPSPIRSVTFVGHTDPVGSNADNERLGQQRADAARIGLVAALERVRAGSARGVSIVARSRGELDQVPGRPSDNRRVELLVQTAVVAGGSPFTLPPDPPNLLPPARTNAKATFLFPGDGPSGVVNSMVQLLRTEGRKPNAWIYLLNWHLDHTVPRPAPSSSIPTLEDELKACSAAGAHIRALAWSGGVPPFSVSPTAPPGIPVALWRSLITPIERSIRRALGSGGLPTAKNAASVRVINAIPRAFAHLDDQTLSFGSHHHKLLVVGNADQVVAVVGGVDWNRDRLFVIPTQKGTPLWDISVKVEGAPALDLAAAFEQRWRAHPRTGPTPLPIRPTPGRLAPGSDTVQVGVNYGCAKPLTSIRHAVTGGSNLIENLLEKCRRYFYLECQYGLGHARLMAAIHRAFSNGAELGIVVLAGTGVVSDFPEVEFWRHKFWSSFPEIDRKLLVFERFGDNGRVDGPHAYVHSKLCMVDDQAASVGTLNLSRRSWRHDSEMTAVVARADKVAGLRTDLWPWHLQLGPGDRAADLASMLRVWREVHSGARPMPRVRPIRYRGAPPPPRLLDAATLLAPLPAPVRGLLPIPALQRAIDGILDDLHHNVTNPEGPLTC